MDHTIVIPCFNERDNVALIANDLMPVVDDLRANRSVEVIFVDDGSTDGTGDLLEARFGNDQNTQIVRHDRNRGLGAALRTAFRQSSGDVVITTDCDGSYPFSLILPLLRHLQPGVGVVTASCYHPRGGMENVPAHRILLSKTASLIYRSLVDWHIHTYTCMFRAYRREVIEKVGFASDDFLSVTELLVNAALMGFAIREMPCTLRARRHGVSKAKLARTVLSHLGFQWNLVRAKYSRPLRSCPR